MSNDAKEFGKAYRVVNIPDSLNLTTLRKSLSEALQIDGSMLTIWSMASDAVWPSSTPSRVATVSFRERPKLLIEFQQVDGKKSKCDEWRLLLPGSSNADPAAVTIDDHFRGFTPLSPIRNESDYTIEYIVL